MNKATLGIIVSVIAVLILAGVVASTNRSDNQSATTNNSTQSSSQDSGENSQQNAEVAETTSVEIKDFAYAPERIRVKVGDTVTWTNQDTTKHDVTPDDESDAFKASELLAKGESYSFTFNTPGIYSYHCSPHPHMKGVVEVVE